MNRLTTLARRFLAGRLTRLVRFARKNAFAAWLALLVLAMHWLSVSPTLETPQGDGLTSPKRKAVRVCETLTA